MASRDQPRASFLYDPRVRSIAFQAVLLVAIVAFFAWVAGNAPFTWRLGVPTPLAITRDQFIEEMTERNIATSVHFIPINLHPYYRDKYQLLPDRFPVAVDNYSRMLSLPLNARMSDDDALDVIDAVLDIVRIHQR